MKNPSAGTLLEVTDLSVRFSTSRGEVHAVRGVSFSLEKERVLGIVGESGSGKSVSSLAIMGLIPPPGAIDRGSIRLGDSQLLSLSDKRMRSIRGGRIAMIFQEPMTSLNPIHTCGRQIAEALILHRGMGKRDARDAALEALRRVNIPLPEKRLKEYPHQLSGGMRQRVMIAMAMSCEPELLIADEPTTALDVTIQAQILDLMIQLKETTRTGILMITHDLGVVKAISDRIVVMYLGRVMEEGPADRLFEEPLHPYTQGLLRSIPRLQSKREPLYVIKKDVPNPLDPPRGCGFHPRCPMADEKCRREPPPITETGDGRRVRCWRYG